MRAIKLLGAGICKFKLNFKDLSLLFRDMSKGLYHLCVHSRRTDFIKNKAASEKDFTIKAANFIMENEISVILIFQFFQNFKNSGKIRNFIFWR